jgi:membrane-associated phospholipid phosphatase
MSFFLATPVVLAVLWLQRPDRFRRYVRLLIGLWACALVFFTLSPTVPPWLASAKGMIGPVTRIVAPIGLHVPIFDPAVLWERGVRLANDLAAFPSLHEAMTLLIAIFFWPTARRPVRVLLALYPLAMAFTLIYTGEHYVTDLVGGALLTVLVVMVEARVAELRSARGAARADREHRGRARALGADDQPAVRAGLAHDRVRP